MIPIRPIIDKVNARITAADLQGAEYVQATSTNESLTSLQATTTANSAFLLPDPADHEGRIFYVIADQKHYLSDGTRWTSNLTSNEEVATRVGRFTGTDNSFGQSGGSGGRTQFTSSYRLGGSNVAITQIRKLAVGRRFGAVVVDDGRMFLWGENNYGQLGVGDAVSRATPVTPLGGITNWVDCWAGGRTTFALTANNVLYGWGYNGRGTIGDGTVSTRQSPVTVVGGITDWRQLAVGETHTIGLTRSGLLYTWGWNNNGRLGDNSGISRSSPGTTARNTNDWVDIASGSAHGAAVASNGTLWTWGRNSSGQLGNGQTLDTSSPATVIGGITNWSRVFSGCYSYSTMGLTNSGILYAWGRNNYGLLGVNDTTNRSSPTTVVGGITNWITVTTSLNHAAGITSDGLMYTWGSGTSYRTARSNSVLSPVVPNISGFFNNQWVQVGVGENFTHGVQSISDRTRGFF